MPNVVDRGEHVMNRRFLGLTPFLAVIVLAVAPAVSQAEPHWYLGSTPLKAGKKTTVKTEGKLLFSIPGTTIQVSCAVKDVEVLLNPLGGGAGVDTMKSFKLSSCGPNPCPVLASGKQGPLKVNTLKLPWASRLVELPPTINDEFPGIEIEFACKKVPLITVSGTLFPNVNPGFLEFTPFGTLSGMTVTGIDNFIPAGISAKNP
jgi:hypothetical protein